MSPQSSIRHSHRSLIPILLANTLPLDPAILNACTPCAASPNTFSPDYGIWYRDKEDIELNVVIMEAKRPMNGSQGIPQALAYMGKYISISLLEPLGLTCQKRVCTTSVRISARKTPPFTVSPPIL